MDKNKIKEDIEYFKAEINYPNITPSVKINDIINTMGNPDGLRNLSPEQLSEYSVIIAHYSLFLSTQENRLRSYVNWCESNLKRLIGALLPDSQGFTFQEKDQYIRASNVDARSLEEEKIATQAKLDYINFLSQKLQFLAETMKGLTWEKRKSIKESYGS